MRRFVCLASLLALPLLAAPSRAQDVTTLTNNSSFINLSLPRYGGGTTNQFVEPATVRVPGGWHGHEYWMITTPYPYGDGCSENPCLVYSDDGNTWYTPSGVTNPLVNPPTLPCTDPNFSDLNSDPGVVIVADSMYIYYQQTYHASSQQFPDGYTTFVRLTFDGTSVHGPIVLRLPSNQEFKLDNFPMSPSVVRDPVNGEYLMWYVYATTCDFTSPSNTLVLRTSCNGVDWSAPTDCPISNEQGSLWHMSVMKDGTTYKMLYCSIKNVSGLANCGFTDLYYAESADRVHWRSATSPVLASNRSSNTPWDNGCIYRSSFTVTNGQFDIWYSARHHNYSGMSPSGTYGENEWHMARVTGTLYDANAPSLFGSNASTYLTIPTYDSDNQVVNPDIVDVPGKWNGYQYWMAMTPFPNGLESHENPSVVASNDCSSWTVPSGLTNPIASAPTGGYNNDPDLLLVGSTMVMYYGRTFDASHGSTGNYRTELMRTTSTNGTTWSTPSVVLSQSNYVMSPTVIYESGTYYLWYVQSSAGCPSSSQTMYLRSSTDGINWGSASTVSFSNLSALPFEMDIVKDGSTYKMLLAAYDSGSSCGFTSLYYATSTNRTSWTVNTDPVLRATSVGWDNAQIYRSTFTAAGSLLRIWYSGRHTQATQCGSDPLSQDQYQVGYTEVCLSGGDCVPPAPVCDLAAAGGCTLNHLSWTAPGDNGGIGQATAYDLRYSTSLITDATFSSCSQLSVSAPQTPGSSETVDHTVGSCSSTYYYALKTRDENSNWSRMSNVVSAHTFCPGPHQICDDEYALRPTGDRHFVFSLGTPVPNPTAGAVDLRFSLPDGATGGRYELAVYDVAGRRLALVQSGVTVPGSQIAHWDLRTGAGERVRSGLYFVRLRMGGQVLTRTLSVLP